MAFLSDLRSLWQPDSGVSLRLKAELRNQTEAFCSATALAEQTGRLIDLFSGIFQQTQSAYTSPA